jgi:hypothetical protein
MKLLKKHLLKMLSILPHLYERAEESLISYEQRVAGLKLKFLSQFFL